MLIAQLSFISNKAFGGTPIHGIPDWIVEGWRTLLWTTMAVLTVKIFKWAWDVRKNPQMRASMFGRLSLMVFVLRSAVTQAESWHSPVTIEGLPFTTLAVVLSLIAIMIVDRQTNF